MKISTVKLVVASSVFYNLLFSPYLTKADLFDSIVSAVVDVYEDATECASDVVGCVEDAVEDAVETMADAVVELGYVIISESYALVQAFGTAFSGSDLLSTDYMKRLWMQHYLDYHVPLFEASFFGTHNSYNSEAYDYAWPNQALSVTAQLGLGMRAISFDIHDDGNGNPILCHDGYLDGTLCSNNDSSFAAQYAEIIEFLEFFPFEVVILIIEDHTTSASALSVKNTIKYSSSGLVYTPNYHYGHNPSNCDDEPLPIVDVTKKNLLDARKRLLIVTDDPCEHSDVFWNKFIFKMNYSANKASSFSMNSGKMSTESALRLVYEDRAFAFWQSSNTLSKSETQDAIKNGVNIIGLDFPYTDGTHTEGLIWSWDANEPNFANGACAVQQSSGYWKIVGCGGGYRFACQDVNTGNWRVTGGSGPFNAGQNACAGIPGPGNWQFALPANGNYNYQLKQARPTGVNGAIYVNFRKWNAFT